MAKCIKSVSFNEKNEKDVLILKHVKRRNFSGYVKKLILQDITSKQTEKQHSAAPAAFNEEVALPVKHEEQPKKLSNAEKLEKLKKQTKKQQTPQNPLPFMPNQPKH